MVPDDARLRLQTLAAPPEPAAFPGPDAGAPRGWPTAPEGTPGARLRVGEEGIGPAFDDDDGAAPVPGRPPPAVRSAWDEPRGLGRWLPASWLTARWDPGGWGAVGLAVVAALAAVAAAVGVWAGRPVTEPVPPLPVVSAAAPARGSVLPSLAVPGAVPASGGPVIVNVAGKVRRPGLVTMREGARVGEAVDAAGGALPHVDLTPLNLAARVVDGQQILVGVAGAAAAPGPSAPSAGGAGTAPAPGGSSTSTPRPSSSSTACRASGR